MTGKRLSGNHVIRFREGHKTFTTTVTVPAGSQVSLQGVALSSGGTADPEEEDIDVDGTLTAVDCNATPNTLTITPGNGGTAVVMSFDPTVTQITDESTDTVITSCATLAGDFINAPAKAEGVETASGGINATEVQLNPSQNNPQPEEVHFSGIVQSENCPSSIVVQRSDGTNVTVNIASSTEINIEDSEQQSQGTCSSIPAGAIVKVEGTSQGSSVNAASIEVRQNEFESEGTINSTNCGANPPSLSFTPDSASSAVVVTIGPTTIIEVGDNKGATCADVASGAAKVEGVAQPDGSVAASKIEQEGEGSDGHSSGR